jgi:hypothetical protein
MATGPHLWVGAFGSSGICVTCGRHPDVPLFDAPTFLPSAKFLAQSGIQAAAVGHPRALRA